MENFSPLFESGTKIEDKGMATAQIDERYTWVSMVDRLSGGDITKHDKVYEMNYIACLNLLSFWRERDNYQEQQNKQMMAKYK